MKTNTTPPKHPAEYLTYEEYVNSRVQPTGLQLQVIPKTLYNALRDKKQKEE
jgi:hypothetical protein